MQFASCRHAALGVLLFGRAMAFAQVPAVTQAMTHSEASELAVPLPVEVPHKLARRVALELSGIAWVPQLGRYVMVSDDVTVHHHKHVPLLFTMNEQGRLDAKPITIDGIDALNDPESITLGPSGTLFVCTSHSINAHGHLRASRSLLLQLEIGKNRRAHILGQVDLRLARSVEDALLWPQHAPGLRSDAMSSDDASRLDIEAIAFRDGSLYVGLKASLASDGRARILRLSGAVAALAAGSIPKGGLSLWSASRFCVAQAGANVCEGIADLAFLADGRLLVVANSPKHAPFDGGGSLWELAAPNAEPKLLQRYPGLKPEGVALAPNGQIAVIVFDRDGAPPLWARWRLGS